MGMLRVMSRRGDKRVKELLAKLKRSPSKATSKAIDKANYWFKALKANWLQLKVTRKTLLKQTEKKQHIQIMQLKEKQHKKLSAEQIRYLNNEILLNENLISEETRHPAIL